MKKVSNNKIKVLIVDLKALSLKLLKYNKKI